MAKEKPIYRIVEEFESIVSKLVSNNSDILGTIDTNSIKMVSITNKESPGGCPFKIILVKSPISMFLKDLKFIIRVFDSDWNAYCENQKALVILDVLFSISEVDDEPKVVPFDLADHSQMIKTFGVNYVDNPSIENILDKPINWNRK